VGEFTVDTTIDVGPIRTADLTKRIAALALTASRERLVAEIAGLPAVQRWRTLGTQIDAARKVVADAERTFRRVEAAKRLLEDNPSDEFANKLREVEAQHAAAVAAKARAERDLETVRHLVPKHWTPAAQAVHSAVSAASIQHMIATSAAADAVDARLTAAAEKVAEVVAAAVAEHLVPVAFEALAMHHARRAGRGGHGALADEMRAEFCGPVPDGVRPAESGCAGRFEVVPPPPPPAPPAPPEPQIRELLPIQTYGGPVRR
jgi:hypothetical protein